MVETSDFELIEKLSTDHTLTSIKICTDRAVTGIKGVQASYGLFDQEGEISNSVSMTPFGDLEQANNVCTNFYIPRNDVLASVLYRYDLNTGLTMMWLTTAAGRSSSYGKQG